MWLQNLSLVRFSTIRILKKFSVDFVPQKKALVVANTEVQIAYCLSKIEFDLNKETKTLTILNIAEPELKFFQHSNIVTNKMIVSRNLKLQIIMK